MPIQVTCPECHTRFNVSEKFAGKEGPCPKCKAKIRVPDKNEEVLIAEPTVGPTDSKGRQVLKPIARTDSSLSQLQIGLIVGALVVFIATAFFIRLTYEDKVNFPFWMLAVSALVIAPPVALGAYNILKDSDLESFKGKDLWVRILICGGIYAILWMAMPLSKYAFGDQYETGTWIAASIAMLGGGAAVGMLALDFDYLTGLLHYGLYLGFCLLGRFIAGIGVLPGALEQPPIGSGTTIGFQNSGNEITEMILLLSQSFLNW